MTTEDVSSIANVDVAPDGTTTKESNTKGGTLNESDSAKKKKKKKKKKKSRSAIEKLENKSSKETKKTALSQVWSYMLK